MKRYLKYALLVLLVVLLGYKSVYIEKLSEHNSKAVVKFDPVDFSKKLWEEKMPARADSAVELSLLVSAITKDKETGFSQYTNTLAIGNYRYALVKADAKVEEVNEDEILLSYPLADSVLRIQLATEFIYGNAVRDASGLVKVKDFPNTADLNGISEELNKLVKTRIIQPVKDKVKKGDLLSVAAALELNKEHIHWQGIELLPVRIQIKP